MESNQAASRAARRFLQERVRDDWDWPNTPDCWSASDEEVRGIGEFRERYYGTSSSEHESDKEASEDPYKFDSPDSIGDAVEMKLRARKRRRRIAVEKEATWNEGLACFVARQQVWTGAAAVKKYGTHRPAKTAPEAVAVAMAVAVAVAEGDSPETPATPPTPSSSIPAATTPPPPEASPSHAPDEPLLPVAPPLLQGNAIRTGITPKSYPDIYNKVVMSSRSPLVPINLADMTKALVQGWKDNGEWPPKATPLDPLAGRKRALASVKLDHNGDHHFLEHHPHVKKGMESVKRILHLNGTHHEHHEHGPVGNNG